MQQEPPYEVLQDPQQTKKSLPHKIQLHSLARVAAVLFIVLLTGTLFLVLTHLSTGPMRAGTPPSLAWAKNDGQFLASNTEGTFNIKYIDITSQEFRFFYAFHSSNLGIPKVVVSSSLPSDHATVTRLSTTVQSLGYLDTYNIGVVHASRLNRVGQIITLQVTVSSESSLTLHLTPLKQLLNNPSGNWGFPTQQKGVPEVIWYGPVKMEDVAFFKSGDAKSSKSYTSHIFMRIDNPGVVRVISQAEYLIIAGKQNFF